VAAVIVVAFGEHLSPLLAVLLAASVLGVILVGAGGGGEQVRAQGRGVVLVVVATLFTGCVLALGPPVFRELGTWWGFLAIRVFTLVIALVVAVASGRGAELAPALRGEPWRIAVWGLGDAGAYLLYLLAAERGPIAVAGVLAAQFATFGTLSGVVLLGERLHRRQWLGVVVVLAAVSGVAAIT
jgi:drug/metabolite transporter (DMT)-like permease